MTVGLSNGITGSYTQPALLISQPGPASGWLNLSSPLKVRGFHVRFSELELTKRLDPYVLLGPAGTTNDVRREAQHRMMALLNARCTDHLDILQANTSREAIAPPAQRQKQLPD